LSTQGLAGVGADGQTVVADIALTRALADLAQVALETFLAGVVQFRSIVQQQHGARAQGRDRPACLGSVPVHQDLVRDLRLIHEAIKAAQIRRPIQLVWQRAARTPAHLFNRLNKPIRASLVAQIDLTEVRLSERKCRVHARDPWDMTAGTPRASHPILDRPVKKLVPFAPDCKYFRPTRYNRYARHSSNPYNPGIVQPDTCFTRSESGRSSKT
jgi:hypothetical protein